MLQYHAALHRRGPTRPSNAEFLSARTVLADWCAAACKDSPCVRSAESHISPPLSGVSPLSLSLHSGLSLCGAVVVSGPRSRHRVCSSITGSFRVRVTVKMESPPSAFLAANRRSDSFHICTECGGGLAYSCDCPSLKIFSMKHFN